MARHKKERSGSFADEGEPDLTPLIDCVFLLLIFFMVTTVFLHTKGLEVDLPAKSDSIQGITWLPRIIPKALGKLRGELDPEIMYCCGGDREFFRTHDIHPAEFLRVAWAWEEEPDKIVAWVLDRSKQT